MQLLAACQKAPGLERLVVKSSSRVYGSSSRDPAMFTEDMSAKRLPRTGYAKDVLEVEGYVRGFARRRPDVAVTTAAGRQRGRSAGSSSPLTDYFRLPVVPTVLGHDPRLQLLHEDDLLGALQHAALGGVHGTFNVAGDGVLMLSQALRRLGRPTVPLPALAIGWPGRCPAGRRPAPAERAHRLPHLRPRPGHHPDAHGAGLPPDLHHRGGLRRLRPHRAARPAAAAARPGPRARRSTAPDVGGSRA